MFTPTHKQFNSFDDYIIDWAIENILNNLVPLVDEPIPPTHEQVLKTLGLLETAWIISGGMMKERKV